MVESVNGAETIQREPALGSIDAPALSPGERAALVLTINSLRMGVDVFVYCEYDKQLSDPPRVSPGDFLRLPDDPEGKRHLGWLVAAPTNRDGEPYLRMKDIYRGDGEAPWDWTSFKPCGLTRFQVRSMRLRNGGNAT